MRTKIYLEPFFQTAMAQHSSSKSFWLAARSKHVDNHLKPRCVFAEAHEVSIQWRLASIWILDCDSRASSVPLLVHAVSKSCVATSFFINLVPGTCHQGLAYEFRTHKTLNKTVLKANLPWAELIRIGKVPGAFFSSDFVLLRATFPLNKTQKWISRFFTFRNLHKRFIRPSSRNFTFFHVLVFDHFGKRISWTLHFLPAIRFEHLPEMHCIYMTFCHEIHKAVQRVTDKR